MKPVHLLKNGDRLVMLMGVDGNDLYKFPYYLRTYMENNFYKGDLSRISGEKKEEDKNKLFLAKIGNQVVGYIRLAIGTSPMSIHVGEAFLLLDENYRGLGIDKLLVKQLIYWTKETGRIRKINIKVRADDKPEIAFYKRLGFQTEGLLKQELYSDGIFFDAEMLGLWINPPAEQSVRRKVKQFGRSPKPMQFVKPAAELSDTVAP
ncbi:acyl-coa n-acyltransferase [Lucifera butyrica]|uniref:Acyl-coa n-acyltransferase n=1 Tax=Lucifera butyrica TaxID=1351585 RepID=A0A498R8Z2_9FIRM|nr:GNAT family N-acetyltransferase [Lucifera butyrica]VBB07417.1 acyl-coa n-acyltransferase [Lucifera butyrica]